MSVASAPSPVNAPAARRPSPSSPPTSSASLLDRVTRWDSLVMLLGLAGAIGVLFARWFANQHENSWGNPDWSHAYFIPLISVYLLWHNRASLERARLMVFWPGLVPIVMGIWCYVFFIVGVPNHFGQGLSLVLTIFGATLLLLGPRAMQDLFLPIAFLVFAITVPDKIMTYLTYPLQDLAAGGGYFILRLFGVNADLAGNVIHVVRPNGTIHPLNVATQCSGMRTVIAFLALGAAVAIVGTREWWRRVVLFVMALPVAVLLNMLRIAVLGMLALYNPDFSEGEAHTLVGTLLLIPGFFFYLGVLWAMSKAAPEPQEPVRRDAPARAASERAMRTRWAAFASAMLLMLASAGALNAAIAAFKIYTRKVPITVELKCPSVPTSTPHWERIGADQEMDEATLETLGTRNYVSRHYLERHPAKGKDPRVLDFHMAYYTGAVDTVPHVPDRCFVTGGEILTGGPWNVPVPLSNESWSEDSQASADMRAALGEPGVKIYTARMGPESRAPGNRVRLPRGVENLQLRVFEFKHPGSNEPIYAGYFFIANGGLTPMAEGVRLLAFDLHSDYAFYMKVQFTATRIKGKEELAQLAGSMLDDILPEIMQCVPDWVDVMRGDYPADNPRRNARGVEPKAG